jgi:putative RNA 2'-phosphotransferase
MHDDGIAFYLSNNGVWLTDYINPKYIIKEEED